MQFTIKVLKYKGVKYFQHRGILFRRIPLLNEFCYVKESKRVQDGCLRLRRDGKLLATVYFEPDSFGHVECAFSNSRLLPKEIRQHIGIKHFRRGDELNFRFRVSFDFLAKLKKSLQWEVE